MGKAFIEYFLDDIEGGMSWGTPELAVNLDAFLMSITHEVADEEELESAPLYVRFLRSCHRTCGPGWRFRTPVD